MKTDYSFSTDKSFLMIMFLLLVATIIYSGSCSEEERRLVEHLFDRQDYNAYVRPIKNLTDKIKVYFEMSLIQIITLDERNQIMKTNIWLRFGWEDHQLHWDPKQFGSISVLRILPYKFWKPDIVLFNNADGRFEVSFKANILIYEPSLPQGNIMWIPCAIYKSSCSLDVTYFPFDEQECKMYFGSWTYNGDEVDLEWYNAGYTSVDLSNYEKSGTWDLFDVPGNITWEFKDGQSRTQTVYTLRLRRKTLYYTINLIIPCILISSLSMFLFYLPVNAGEKVAMSIAILLALVVFLQVLVTNLLPPSSITLPLFARYLLFTILMDVCTITNTMMVLYWSNKTPRTHRMPRWVRIIFFKYLPKILLMKRPASENPNAPPINLSRTSTPSMTPTTSRRNNRPQDALSEVHHPNCPLASVRNRNVEPSGPKVSPELNKAVEAVRFISAYIKNEDDFGEVIDDWKYIALLVDRLLLVIYMVVTVVCTVSILINAPRIFDSFDQEAYRESKEQEHRCRENELTNFYAADPAGTMSTSMCNPDLEPGLKMYGSAGG